MAARSVFKFLTKTCSYSLNPACTSSNSPLEDTQKIKLHQRVHRSYSQPPRLSLHSEIPEPNTKISKSLENLQDKFTKKLSRYIDKASRDDEEHQTEHEEDDRSVVYSEYRESAREFKEKYVEPERNDDANPIYELAEGPRKDIFQVRRELIRRERNKNVLFPHLQPNNVKPFGSTENLYCPELFVRKPKIVYPIVNTSQHDRRRRIDDVQHNDFSSFRKEAVTSKDLTKTKISHDKSRTDIATMNYSTCQVSKKTQTKPPKLPTGALIRKSNCSLRKSSTTLVKKKKFPIDSVLEANKLGIMEQFYKRANAYKELRESGKKTREKFLKCDSRRGSAKNVLLEPSKNCSEGRRFNTYSGARTTEDRNCSQESFLRRPKLEEVSRSLNSLNNQLKPSATREAVRSRSYAEHKAEASADVICDEYVTVKLSELQEECRREKRCKPKKICFGRLPHFKPMNCPCIEEPPLKEGKPLLRIKKRFDVVPKARICEELSVCDIPRADDNYQIKRKTLPKLELHDCPCVEKEYLDFTIKRLPKKKIPEPPKSCDTCEELGTCCPPRADDGMKLCPKTLPKLKTNNCPCIEPIPPLDIPLTRLKPKHIKEPERICVEGAICDIPRADDGYQIKPKVLPVLKSDCICMEPPPLLEAPPLVRLKKIDIKEKPRESCEVETCASVSRADDKLKAKHKKLCPFVPRICPCIEEEPPSGEVKLKRLKPRPVQPPKRICPDEIQCEIRADHDYVIKPKKLPEITAKECPCIIKEIVDTPPLKRLIPKPVKEPEKICPREDLCDCMERADKCIKAKKKCLPKLPPGNCPCIEPEPPSIMPRLGKLKKRPVKEPERICPDEDKCTTPRSDENLKVKIKQLPKLEVPDCPCIEPPVPEDVRPLRRLRRKPVQEPPRICPPEDDCAEAQRADEHDWLYWKRIEVKKGEPCKPTKRSYSTKAKSIPPSFGQQKKFFGTNISTVSDLFEPKYDASNCQHSHLQGKAHSVVIDIKPSIPLILTQAPIKHNEEESFNLKPLRSEQLDSTAFMIYKSNSGHSQPKSGSEGYNCLFNRFISTCSALYDHSEKSSSKDYEMAKESECPRGDRHLQPKNPIIKEKETFIQPYPDDTLIDNSIKKSRLYYRTRKPDSKIEGTELECQEEVEKALCEVEEDVTCPPEKKPSLWEKIVNYFKARPDCPSPEEFKKMRLREDAEKAAEKAGLCLYDPKEMLRKNEKAMPKVITASNMSKDEECRK